MSFDNIRIGWVDAHDTPALLCLVKDDIDRADQGVSEMKRCDVFGQSTDLLQLSHDG